ncbi:BON domain-containing protein [Chlorogloea sp. CCALA 695]|uniref:BON domain-containing protein n=1 Tax=Chlorogloea sp. CCALA 695 TaxID=2107693 RepID=UPI000D05AF40|nr:BON domain-containing protein [Chlorogloea sp. CCALA 695]PSB35056.1 transporter [Chlorogloea sp. CCALA 695]
MKKFIPLIIGSFLIVSTVGCQDTAKTSTDAPNNAGETVAAPKTDDAAQVQNDATSEVRREQLNSDIRAREQRNNASGGDADRAEGDLQSEVRSKLEANLPASQLGVEAEDGVVTVSGTVPTDEQLQKVEPLAKEIKGVTSVKVNVQVKPAKPSN